MMHFDLALIYLETAILNETISVYNIYIYIIMYISRLVTTEGVNCLFDNKWKTQVGSR